MNGYFFHTMNCKFMCMLLTAQSTIAVMSLQNVCVKCCCIYSVNTTKVLAVCAWLDCNIPVSSLIRRAPDILRIFRNKKNYVKNIF